MPDRRPDCSGCLIRNLRFSDHIKKGLVQFRAFRDKDPDGLSLTETRDEIWGMDDLEDYRTVVSEGLEFRVGVALFEAEPARQAGLTWRPNLHNEHRFGHLHVLGPR